jgi:ElaB/YqjD/DUF883 family membrane-anchored ribosome-binding protein
MAVMSVTTRSAGKEAADIDAIVEGIATLKHDLAVLTDRLKRAGMNGLKDTEHESVAELRDEAEAIYRSLAAQGGRTAKVIGRAVEEQPIASLLIAFGIGLISGRLLSD